MDLGTNTFHLIIVEVSSSGLTEIIHEEEAVKLGEGGINKGFIKEAAFERGVQCMKRFAGLIAAHHVQGVRAIATSALRNAANAPDFIDTVKRHTTISIEIIDGHTEASFIYHGVKTSECLGKKNSLIADIGGGSVEFIICNQHEIFWQHSFEIGAARLMDRFHRSDPIPPDSINALNLYLEGSLATLFQAAKRFPVENLIGSSGVFESYAAIIEKEKGRSLDLKKTTHYSFDQAELLALIERIVLSTHQQRLAESDIIPVRVDMIVTASLLARFILQKLNIDEVAMCTYSLKEGVLAEMMS